jgi:hypothetical protein
MNGFRLSSLPLSGKLFCTLFLLGIGSGSLAAFVQASTAVGLSPAAVEASLAPAMPMTHMGHGQMSAEKEITIGDISSTAKVWIRTPLLIQTSHTHLFGQTLIAGLLGLSHRTRHTPLGLTLAQSHHPQHRPEFPETTRQNFRNQHLQRPQEAEHVTEIADEHLRCTSAR